MAEIHYCPVANILQISLHYQIIDVGDYGKEAQTS